MRKTLIAIFVGLSALAAAACGPGGTPTTSPAESLVPGDSIESLAPIESPVESPSDMLESPASS